MPTRIYSLLLCSSLAWGFLGIPLVPTPALTYSTYLRGGFTPKAIATDSSGNVYLAGSGIVDATTTQIAAMVLKLDPKGSRYLYTRWFAGSLTDAASAIAVDSAGNT